MSDFSPDTLRRSVHNTLDEAYAAIPDGKNHVLLIDGTVGDGSDAVRALYAQRIAGGWQVVLEGDWHGGTQVAGKIAALKAW
jgi:hypothetical protein